MTTYSDKIVLVDGVSYTLQKVAENVGKATKKVETLQQKIGKINGNLKSFGKSMSLFVTAPLLAMGGASLKSAMQMEESLSLFSTMLGSAEAGSKMYNDILKMGASTPFQAKDLAENAKLMLNFGLATDTILPNLQMLGDISGGNAQRLGQLSLAFSQMGSVGKLMGQDLLQMINAGFNPLQIISEKTGESMEKLKKRMAKGKISFEEVKRAMASATSEGGRFNGLMNKVSKTAGGQFSNLKDDFEMLKVEIGQQLLPMFIDFMKVLKSLMAKFSALSPQTKKIIFGIAGITAVIAPLVVAIGVLGSALLLLSANPIVLMITGIVAGCVLMYKWAEKLGSLLAGLIAKWNGLTNATGLGTPIIEAGVKQNNEYINKISQPKNQTPISQSNNQTNNMTFMANVREEADINKIGQSMIGELKKAGSNMGTRIK